MPSQEVASERNVNELHKTFTCNFLIELGLIDVYSYLLSVDFKDSILIF